MEQYPTHLEIGKRTERTPSAASSFRPHRPVPKPIPILQSSHAPLLDSSLASSPPYTTYSRPRRDSLATSSPTSPASSSSSFTSSTKPSRLSISPRTLKALRRREIVHPSNFAGAIRIGRQTSRSELSPSSNTAVDSRFLTEVEPETRLSSSAETSATSVFIEECSKDWNAIDSDESLGQKMPSYSRNERKTVHFDNFASLNGGSPPPDPPLYSLLKKPRSLIRIFSIKRTPNESRSSTDSRRSGSTTLQRYPSDRRRRSISLPPLVTVLEGDKEKERSVLEEDKASKLTIVERPFAKDGTGSVQAELLVPSPIAPTSPIQFQRTSQLGSPVVSSAPKLSEIPEDEEEVNEKPTSNLVRRHSTTSYISMGTSIGPYRSLFRMFEGQEREIGFSEIPQRADSITVPNLPGFTISNFTPASASCYPRPESPSSVYPPTISVSFPDAESLADPLTGRRQLRFGPRPLETLQTSDRLEIDRCSPASTAFSDFANFPIPPDLSSSTSVTPSVSLPSVPSLPSPSPQVETTHQPTNPKPPRPLNRAELLAFLSS
ncbi:hypothetical protein JCM3765_002114 [Sporobolomyces pararoseus]